MKKALLAEYRKNDIYQLLYLVHFLESYKNVLCTETDDILEYCHRFNSIAKHCIEKGVLTLYTARVWFVYGLPLSTSSKLVWKFSIDTEDPTTVNYKELLKSVMQWIASNRAFQYLCTTQTPLQQAEVVEQLQLVSMEKEQRPVGLNVAIDQLMKTFEKLSVNLVQQIQS